MYHAYCLGAHKKSCKLREEFPTVFEIWEVFGFSGSWEVTKIQIGKQLPNFPF